MGGITTWKDEEVERLKALWKKGDSAAVIAVKMNYSRNAILGKVHRLKLEKRSNRNGYYYGPAREVVERSAPKRIYRNSVFKMPGARPEFIAPPPKAPPLIAVMSPITGGFMRSSRRRPNQPEYTKDQLRAQLAQAVANTARMA